MKADANRHVVLTNYMEAMNIELQSDSQRIKPGLSSFITTPVPPALPFRPYRSGSWQNNCGRSAGRWRGLLKKPWRCQCRVSKVLKGTYNCLTFCTPRLKEIVAALPILSFIKESVDETG